MTHKQPQQQKEKTTEPKVSISICTGKFSKCVYDNFGKFPKREKNSKLSVLSLSHYLA